MMEEKENLNKGSRVSPPMDGDQKAADKGPTDADTAPIGQAIPDSPAQGGHAVPDETDLLKSQLTELNDKYLRAIAEVENTRRRAELDIQNISRNRAMKVAEKILPLIDAISAAAQHAPDNDGIRALAAAADSALEKIGIAKIESVGQTLNPLLHNAIQTIESDAPAGQIAQELQAGYQFGDAVLRPAMVVVAK